MFKKPDKNAPKPGIVSDEQKELSSLSGINKQTLDKLKTVNLASINILAKLSPEELKDAAGLTIDRATKIINEIKDKIFCTFMNGCEIKKMFENNSRLKTSVESIDALFEGGLRTQAIYEFVGAFGSGKTQIMHHLAVVTQLPEERGGLNGSVVYIDTENTFRDSRIEEIATRFGIDPTEALENVYVTRPMTPEIQARIITKFADEDIEKIIGRPLKKPLKLIIIDSIIFRLRSSFMGRENLPERQQLLNKMLVGALNFSIKNNAVVAVTNQMISDPGALNPMFASDKPAGGNVMAHGSTYRLILRKMKGEIRLMKVVDSPDLSQSEATYMITEGGITDT